MCCPVYRTGHRGDTWEQAILQLAMQVYSQPAELEAWLMDAVTAMQETRLNDRGNPSTRERALQRDGIRASSV